MGICADIFVAVHLCFILGKVEQKQIYIASSSVSNGMSAMPRKLRPGATSCSLTTTDGAIKPWTSFTQCPITLVTF